MRTGLTILIINIHSSLNAGDLALLKCTIEQLQRNFIQPKFILSANWPDEDPLIEIGWPIVSSPLACSRVGSESPIGHQILTTFWTWLAAHIETRSGIQVAKGSGRQLFDAYQKADLVVGVGGNQFYSTGRFGWPFPATSLSVELAHIYRKPFYNMPQSFGPLKRFWERWIFTSLYRKARLIQVRDGVSQRLAAQLGLSPEKIFYIPDPAFDFSPARKEAALAVLHQYGYSTGTPALGVTILGNMGHSLSSGQIEHYYEVMADILRRLVEQLGVRVYLFIQVSGPTWKENDRVGAQVVLDKLGDHLESVLLVDQKLTPELLKACYGCMDFFLPTRLHSGIFALGMGVPCLFIGYLTKTRGILEKIGLEDWMIELGSLDGEILWKRIETAWQERLERAAFLRAKLPSIIETTRLAGIRIAEDYDSYVKT